MQSHPQLFFDPTAQEPPEIARPKPRKGHLATPSPIGSGPPGETCKTCEFATRLKYHDKVYYKCKLLERYWSHGGATDIKLKWESCKHWLPKDFSDRVLALGEYAKLVVEQHGWLSEPMLVIADYYDDTQDMGWLRHAATALPQRTGG